MRPDVGSMRRLSIFNVVVLPQPDGPTSTHTSPSGISSESSRTATWPLGYCLLIASRRITASEVGAGCARPASWDGASGGERRREDVIARRYPWRCAVRLGV